MVIPIEYAFEGRGGARTSGIDFFSFQIDIAGQLIIMVRIGKIRQKRKKIPFTINQIRLLLGSVTAAIEFLFNFDGQFIRLPTVD